MANEEPLNEAEDRLLCTGSYRMRSDPLAALFGCTWAETTSAVPRHARVLVGLDQLRRVFNDTHAEVLRFYSRYAEAVEAAG